MNNLKTAVFGGGCFWCTEAVFARLKGVAGVTSGYAGGHVPSPTYEQVSKGTTGHAEVIKIEYDPEQIQYENLLDVFFATHDPTTLNQQGNDVGTQYRSIIMCDGDDQISIATEYIKKLNESKTFNNPIVTEVVPLKEFYPAESHHHKFYDKNQKYPYCTFVIDPKVAKLREKFAHLLK